jgi:hypothetical protein
MVNVFSLEILFLKITIVDFESVSLYYFEDMKKCWYRVEGKFVPMLN